MLILILLINSIHQMESPIQLKSNTCTQNNSWQDEYKNINIGIDSPRPSNFDCEVVIEDTNDYNDPLTDPPKDNFFYAVVSTVLCFAMTANFGMTAIQSSIQCRKAITLKNRDVANAKSEEARGRACLAVLTRVTVWIVIASFIVLGVLS